MLQRQIPESPIEQLKQVANLEEILGAQKTVKEIYVDPLISQYAVAITSATRNHPAIYMGASPRSTLGLISAAQANALFAGRDYTLPDDIKEIAIPTLAHRITLMPESQGSTSEKEILSDILSSIPVENTTPAMPKGGSARDHVSEQK